MEISDEVFQAIIDEFVFEFINIWFIFIYKNKKIIEKKLNIWFIFRKKKKII